MPHRQLPWPRNMICCWRRLGIGVDCMAWLYGLKNMMFAAFDKPEFLKGALEIIASWNRARMQVMLDAGIDLFIKRAWYENCDFWSPKTYRKFVEPICGKTSN